MASLLAALLLLLCLAATGAAMAAISILPLGDSITYGGRGDGGVSFPTYRAWLYQDLGASGYDVDFVGSLNKPDAPAGSDPDNEGHPGYTSGKVLAELPTWLNAYPPPQVALVHLGTNDVLDGVPTARTIADLAVDRRGSPCAKPVDEDPRGADHSDLGRVDDTGG